MVIDIVRKLTSYDSIHLPYPRFMSWLEQRHQRACPCLVLSLRCPRSSGHHWWIFWFRRRKSPRACETNLEDGSGMSSSGWQHISIVERRV